MPQGPFTNPPYTNLPYLLNLKIDVPVVVRLTGTNEDIGREMLEKSGLPIKTASGMSEGARLAVSLAKSGIQV
jgi:succinyl-CoA synthetase beta subunit